MPRNPAAAAPTKTSFGGVRVEGVRGICGVRDIVRSSPAPCVWPGPAASWKSSTLVRLRPWARSRGGGPYRVFPDPTRSGINIDIDIRLRGPRVIVTPAQHTAHDIGPESAGGKKAGLAQALGDVSRGLAEAARPDLASPGVFGALELGEMFADEFGRQVVLAHFPADAGSAETRGAPVDHRFGEAFVAQQALGFEGVEQGLELLGGFGVGRQLALQFEAAVFAPGKK